MKRTAPLALFTLMTGLADGTTRAAAAQSGGFGERSYGHMWNGGDGMGFGVFGAGMMVLVWGIIIFFIVIAVRWVADQGGFRKSTPALDILKERLAKGEIDPAEYESRRKALEG